PDAHPIIGGVGDGVYAACGFSGHGFMQSPAVGKAVAEELLDGEASFDLGPYRPPRASPRGGAFVLSRPVSARAVRRRGRLSRPANPVDASGPRCPWPPPRFDRIGER